MIIANTCTTNAQINSFNSLGVPIKLRVNRLLNKEWLNGSWSIENSLIKKSPYFCTAKNVMAKSRPNTNSRPLKKIINCLITTEHLLSLLWKTKYLLVIKANRIAMIWATLTAIREFSVIAIIKNLVTKYTTVVNIPNTKYISSSFFSTLFTLSFILHPNFRQNSRNWKYDPRYSPPSKDKTYK